MTEEQRPLPPFWADLRRHPAFQSAVIFGGGSWLAVQAADIFGLETAAVRMLGIVLALVFLALAGAAAMLVLRQRAGGGSVRRGLRTRTILAAAAVLLVLGTSAWIARPFVLTSPVRPGADIIAVLPFQASGPAVELLGEGLVDLLTTNLDEVGGIRTIHPRTTLHQYRHHAQHGSIDLEGALRVGRAVQAGSILLGSVVAVGSEVRVTAALHAVDGGRVLARAQKSGDGDNVLSLVDELSIELMRDIWRSREPLPQLRVSAITSPSIPAIRAYMRGEQFYRGLHWDSALVAFTEAITHDSTFALAHFRLAETYGWQENLGSGVALRHSMAAARFSGRLPARERALVLAHELHENGSVAAIDSFQAYVGRYPDDVAGWYMLADARFHAASVLGFGRDELLAGFERAHAMDPTYAQPYAHLLELALQLDDRVRYDEYLARFDEHVTGRTDIFHVIRDVRWAPRARALVTIENALQAGGTQRGSVMNPLGMAAAVRAIGTSDPGFLLETITLLAGGLPPAQALRTVATQQAIGLGAAGRLREADRVLEPLRSVSVEQVLNSSMFFIVSGLAPESLFAAERTLLHAAPARRSAAYWRAVQALSHEDIPAAAREIDVARRDTATAASDVTSALVRGLEGWLAAVQGDTATGIRVMKAALAEHGYSPAAAGRAGPISLQLAILQTRSSDDRDEGIRRLESLRRSDPVMASVALVPLAQAYAARGETGHAAELYNQFLLLWRDADPELDGHLQSARLALRRLGGNVDS